MGLVDKGIEKGFQAYKKATKWAKRVSDLVAFLATPIGWVVGIAVIVIIAIILIVLLCITAYHAANLWFDDGYAGLATTEDYETIISEISFGGYDSFLTEEKWQDFASFEYEVLMDVADHMYEYQDYVISVTDNGEQTYTSAVFPEGTVESEYDAYSITRDEWREMVVSAQGGGKPTINNSTKVEKLGGNREVVTPRLIYETAGHEYEENAISLMPYVVIVRENLELNYFFQDLNSSSSYSHMDEINPSDLSNINPVRYSAELNRYNYDMPNSAYKADLEEDQNEELVLGIEDPEGFIDADRKDTGYGCDVYYTEQETDIVYKIPLKLLINRYLPKATLLSSWYMLKMSNSGDTGNFDVDEMMDTIKQIYSSACYKDGMDGIDPITTSKKIDDDGKIVSTSSVTLRSGKESFETETIKDSIQYNEYGSIKRDEDGNAILKDKKVKYPTTNKRTFIYFEQFGLETTRYEKYKAYTSNVGDELSGVDEARPDPNPAVAKYLTREKNNFVQALNIYIKFQYRTNEVVKSGDETYTVSVIKDGDDIVNLKPTYSHMDEPGVSLDEKSKILYLYGTSTGGSEVQQKPPYSFMADVVKKAEAKMNNREIKKVIDGGEEDETIYEHNLINKYYLIAENAEQGKDGAVDPNKNPEKVKYRLPEDFRYYNQDDAMPHWYDLQEDYGDQAVLENAYLAGMQEVCADKATYGQAIIAMLQQETGLDVIDYYSDSVNYGYSASAQLYKTNFWGAYTDKHVENMNDVYSGNYKVNYYWKAVYHIQEKKLQVKQTVHHVRMPALLVKYCDFWAKSVEYNNKVVQNPIDYKSYKHLIPESVNSLGFQKMTLSENASYRVETFKKYFNKSDNSGDEDGIKENDVMNMMLQWEDNADKGRQ